jgi:hypothetical protein
MAWNGTVARRIAQPLPKVPQVESLVWKVTR